MNVRYVIPILAALLAGCIAEDDTDSVSDGAVSTPEAAILNGFWSSPAGTLPALRVLFFNDQVFAVDDTNGYYGTARLSSDDSVDATLQAYALNAASVAGAEMVADGTSASHGWDVLRSGDSGDVLFGVYRVNGIAQGNIRLEQNDTWNLPGLLARLTAAGEWTTTGYALRFGVPGTSAVTFAAVEEPDTNSGCNFEGRLSVIDSQYNLYRAELIKRESCAAFNRIATGYAGFNADGQLEFYLRGDNGHLLFMTFTPPASAAVNP